MTFTVASLTRCGGIPCYQWPALPEPARFAALMVHGLGDHGQALPYRWLAEALAPAGGAVVSFDHRDHGAAPGGWRAPPRLAQLEDDVRTVAHHVRAGHPDLPLVAIGLSMGALVAVRTAEQAPDLFHGVVAVAAPWGPVAAGRAAIWTARTLGRVLPGMPLETGVDLTAITDNAEALRTYTSDPLFQTRTRLGLAADLLAAVPDLRRAARALATPALFLHGAQDRIAPCPEPAVNNMLVFEEGRHNLFLDHGRAQVFAAITAWVNRLR